MAGSLEGVLAQIPGYGGFLAKRQFNQREQMGQLQQAGALVSLQQHLQRQQQEQEFRAGLAALGPNATQESLAALSAKFSPASDVLRANTSSLDRKASLEATIANRDAQREQASSMQTERLAAQAEVAKQRSVDQALSQADRNQARMEMIRLTASLRPQPPQRNLQLTADEGGNQLIVNADGTTTPLQAPGGGGVRKPVGTDKPMTEFQGKAALYGTRAAQSDKVLKALEDKVDLTGLAAGQATGMVGNAMMSSEQQRVTQAQRDFVNAVLRQESGAVISDAEFDNAKKQYFPSPGEGKAQLDQKRANRALAIKGFARMSGPKGAVDIDAIIADPLLPGVSPNAVTPQANTVKSGYVEVRKTADGRTLGKRADGTIEEVR